eukprot:scaffold43024_cov39-Tisochrysis_lutea.AAC.1
MPVEPRCCQVDACAHILATLIEQAHDEFRHDCVHKGKTSRRDYGYFNHSRQPVQATLCCGRAARCGCCPC